MTEYQFEALKGWIGERSRLLREIHERQNDSSFVRARLRDLEIVDDEARSVLVTKSNPDDGSGLIPEDIGAAMRDLAETIEDEKLSSGTHYLDADGALQAKPSN